MLRDWWVESDAFTDPQAYILRPDSVLALSQAIIDEPTAYLRTRRAALATIELLKAAHTNSELALSKMELRWLNRLAGLAESLPDDETIFIDQMLEQIDHSKLHLAEYGL